jgi:hypothetical protein
MKQSSTGWGKLHAFLAAVYVPALAAIAGLSKMYSAGSVQLSGSPIVKQVKGNLKKFLQCL